MRRFGLPLAFAWFLALPSSGQQHDLIGYWHNWNDVNAPYLELADIDPRYTIIDVAFAEPLPGTSHVMAFSPTGTDQTGFTAQIASFQANGKKVLISIGGANAAVHLDSDQERDEFVSSMLGIINDYGFDGIDIDLEGSSVAISGGTIANPVDASIIRLIDAINSIANAFESANGAPMMLTAAPETAYVQGGMSAFGGIWGAYLPLLEGLRDRIDILHVQLYNSGSMYGIDGGIYAQGAADFIVSQTEALLQGFNTAGGAFAPFPPEKIAIGLPACPSAAGGGYVPPSVLEAAVDYLRGTGPQPGSYSSVSDYPSLRGLMTWSINWDAAPGCAEAYEFAESYETLFTITTSTPEIESALSTIVLDGTALPIPERLIGKRLLLADQVGRSLGTATGSTSRLDLPPLAPGIYYVREPATDGLALRLLVP